MACSVPPRAVVRVWRLRQPRERRGAGYKPVKHSSPASPRTDVRHITLGDPRFSKAEDLAADMPARERHPKSYLHYLCDPTLLDKRLRYRETQGGVRALRLLDWHQVLSVPPHCPFLHAFL